MVISRTIAAVQVRLDSSRLPMKALAPLAGTSSLVEVLCERVWMEEVDLWLLTTERGLDDPLAALGERLGVNVFRGSESDVLSRFARVCELSDATWCVRLTADNPFTDRRILRHLVAQASKAPLSVSWIGDFDHLFPLGYVPEIVRCSVLTDLHHQLPLGEVTHREHVTSAIPLNERLALENFDEPSRPFWRWTVDEEVDLVMAQQAFALFDGRWSSAEYSAFVEALDRHPSITSLNSHVVQRRFN